MSGAHIFAFFFQKAPADLDVCAHASTSEVFCMGFFNFFYQYYLFVVVDNSANGQW